MINNNLISLTTKTNYKVGIYIRLSKEDVDKHIESLSVTNQKNILQSYVKEQNYELYDIYIDDGFTGTNYNRPSFRRMITDIENKKINMVITKDLSRLGRDYIETGEYIEKYFPMHNVRYIALLDGIDTFIDSSNNDIAPFKAVINDMYSKDNSKKIRTALHTMQLKGKWVGGRIPFGYKKDERDKNHLVINDEEAKIVKDIFMYAKKGLTYYQIALKLTEDKVPTPSMVRNNRNSKMTVQGYWSSKTIKGILTNRIYLGDMIQNKNSRVSYKIRKNIRNSPDRWIEVPNTHEALIDRNTFDDIQKILINSKVRSKKQAYRVLDGLLYCYECGHKIMICSPNAKGYTYIVCNYYRMHSKYHLCTTHSNNYDTLESIIFNELKKIFKTRLDYNGLLNNIRDEYENSNIFIKTELKIDEINSNIKLKENQLDKMYLDKIDGNISKEMYNRIKNNLTLDINELNSNKIELLSIIDDKRKYYNKEELCNKIVQEFFSLINPTRQLIIQFIDRVMIHNDKTIDIYLKFRKS